MNIALCIDTTHFQCVCTLQFFTYPLAHSPPKASFLTSVPSPPLTSTIIYSETNGDRVFVQNPVKGKLVRKCTTASTDCHIQIHVQQTSPYTYNVTCPNIIVLIYNHYMLLSHGTLSMTPLPPPCTIITVQVAICTCSICASATRNKTTSASCQGKPPRVQVECL